MKTQSKCCEKCDEEKNISDFIVISFDNETGLKVYSELDECTACRLKQWDKYVAEIQGNFE